MVVSTDIWHVTGNILLLHPAALFFSTLVCPLIVCFVHFSRVLYKPDGCNHRINRFLMMSSFGIPKKFLQRNQIKDLAGGSFDLPASGLWEQDASTAPACSDGSFIRCYLCSKYTYPGVLQCCWKRMVWTTWELSSFFGRNLWKKENFIEWL